MNLEKRSLKLAGHATSLALEPEFWSALEDVAAAQGLSLAALVRQVDLTRNERPLASACRVMALVSRAQLSDKSANSAQSQSETGKR